MSQSMIFGIHPVKEMLEAGKDLDKVFIQKELKSENLLSLIQELKKRDVIIKRVPIEKLHRFTRKNHQGVVAFVSPVTFYKVEEIIPILYEQAKSPLFLILDDITDVRNFGAILRTAESVGVDAVIIGPNNAPVNEDVVKTSTGSIFHIKICKVKSLINTVKFLHDSGISVVAASEHAQELIYQVDVSIPTALVMGNEETGVSEDILNFSKPVKLPMIGKTQSLNVSVACGAFLYEIIRQRNYT